MNYLKRNWLLLPYLAVILFPSLYLAFTVEAELWFDWRYNGAQLAGFMGAGLLMMQLILASRWAWLDRVVGFDKLTRVHKWAGIIGLSLILVHVLGISWYYYGFGLDVLLEFIKPGLRWETLGMVSLDLMVITILITIFYRRWHIPYHWWKRIHFLMYVGIIGGIVHSTFLGSHLVAGFLRWYWLTLAGLALASLLHRRIVVPLMAKPYRLAGHEVIAGSVHHLTLEPIKGAKLQHAPGQFGFIQPHSKGLSREWHPFTISSASSDAVLNFSIKDSGDWTHRLDQLTVGDTVKVEGAYGGFTYQRLPANDLGYVFIAGGIGITPLRSMMRQLLMYEDSQRPMTLLYNGRSKQDLAFKEEFDALAKAHSNFKTVYITSQEKCELRHGRVDQACLQEEIKNLTQQHYFICGPKPMMRAVRKTLNELGVPSDSIHFEEFALN